MPYAPIGDARLYYEEQGSGDPLILLHGAMGAIDLPRSGWATLAPTFAEHYRVVQVDCRGHGRSTNPADALTYPMIADDIRALIDYLGIRPAHIGGVSDGAIAALQIGLGAPEYARTLVCVGANYYNDDLCREANRFADLEIVERDQPETAARWAALHDRNKEPGYWRRLVRQVSENLARYPDYTLEELAQIPCPTLLMAGENDLWGNPDQMLAMRRAIPRAEMLIINNAGHLIQHTHAEIVGPVVLEFLERHADGSLSNVS